MKELLLSVLISLALMGCSSGGPGEDTPEPTANNAPTIPSLASPSNNLLCINNELEFKWSASTDPDGDALKYKIQISKDNQFVSIQKTATVVGTSNTFTLEKGIPYYWRVEAIDSKNKSSGFSDFFSFYTEGIGVSNHLPFSPELINPLNNVILQSGDIELEWNGSDTDSDILTYDVYFDTVNPPAIIVSENQSETKYTINTVSTSTYYWKIVVKDSKGAQTIGQVWNFTTN